MNGLVNPRPHAWSTGNGSPGAGYRPGHGTAVPGADR